MRQRTKLQVFNSENMSVFTVDSDNRYGVIDRLAEWLRFGNIDIDNFSVKIHRYIDDATSHNSDS